MLTTGATTSSKSPMNNAYAARMAFTALPSSVGGFGAITGRVKEPLASTVVAVPARDYVATQDGGRGGMIDDTSG